VNAVLVGNGTSVLDGAYGAAIDAHDLVLRFNSYEVEGYESHVGRRTDVWFTCMRLPDKDFRARARYREVWTLSWQFDPLKDKNYQRWDEWFGAFEPPVPVFKVLKPTHDAMIAFARDHEIMDYKDFSSGLFALWLMLERADHVRLIGFDWWAREAHHYNKDRYPRGTTHRPDRELAFIRALIAVDGRVAFLADELDEIEEQDARAEMVLGWAGAL
jgi:hypothetical protein